MNGARRRILVVGESALAATVAEVLEAAGVDAHRLPRPSDRELRRTLTAEVDGVVVVNRDDIGALRTALMVEYLRPGIRLTVTIFDRTVARQVAAAVPNCEVISMADAAVGTILGPCLSDSLIAHHGGDAAVGIDDETGEPATVTWAPRKPGPLRRLKWFAERQLRPWGQASRLLILSVAGLILFAVVEVLVGTVARDEAIATSLYQGLKALTTTGPGDLAEHGGAGARVYASAMMVIGLLLTAVFAAALVSRLLSRRLIALVGRRTIPRSGHVIVVGLGQVGFRLCLKLRGLGVPVVVVEENPDSPYVRWAKQRAIPVVLGGGSDRFVLERLCLHRARALAAVTSDELTNVAISVAALAVEPSLRTVLRAGSTEVTKETAALFPIGKACDLSRIAGAALAASAMGVAGSKAFAHNGCTYVKQSDGVVIAFPGAAAPATA